MSHSFIQNYCWTTASFTWMKECDILGDQNISWSLLCIFPLPRIYAPYQTDMVSEFCGIKYAVDMAWWLTWRISTQHVQNLPSPMHSVRKGLPDPHHNVNNGTVQQLPLLAVVFTSLRGKEVVYLFYRYNCRAFGNGKVYHTPLRQHRRVLISLFQALSP